MVYTPNCILFDAIFYDTLLNAGVWVCITYGLINIYRLASRKKVPSISAWGVCMIAMFVGVLVTVYGAFSIVDHLISPGSVSVNDICDGIAFLGLIMINLLGIVILGGLVILCLQRCYRTEPGPFWAAVCCFMTFFVAYPSTIAVYYTIKNRHSPDNIQWEYSREGYELLVLEGDPQTAGTGIWTPRIPSLLPEAWRVRYRLAHH